MELKINEELKNLIWPLTDEEYEQRETNIICQGLREPIIVWKSDDENNNTIVDGHNRYEICTENDIPIRTIEMEFGGLQDAKEFMVRNQLGRRNLSNYQRSQLILELEPVIKEKAKENQYTGVPEGEEPTHTREKLAKMAGVSEDTIHKVKTIREKGDEKIKAELDKGNISINKAYNKIMNREKKAEESEELKKEMKENLSKATEEYRAFKGEEELKVDTVFEKDGFIYLRARV